jgi:hypothetical protein
MVLPVPSDHDLSTITRERDHQWHAYSRHQRSPRAIARRAAGVTRRAARRTAGPPAAADQDAAEVAPRRTPCNADRAACGTRGTHPRAAIEPRANKRVADGSRRSTGGDYIGALDSACLEGDSADTAGGGKTGARCGNTSAAITRTVSRTGSALEKPIRCLRNPNDATTRRGPLGRAMCECVHAPLCPTSSPTSRPYTPAPPDCVDGMRLKRPIDGPASGRSKVVFFLLGCCMQEDAARRRATRSRAAWPLRRSRAVTTLGDSVAYITPSATSPTAVLRFPLRMCHGQRPEH